MTKKKRKKYTEEFKREAVRLMLTRGERTVGDVAQSAIADYIDNFYNAWRRHSHNGSVSPNDAEFNTMALAA